MLAIGGAIGVGLFLGSGVTIRLAGPGVIVSYLLGAVIAMIVAYSLAEMAVVHPDAGSFGVYAETYLSRWAGFAVRTTYGLVQMIAIGAEVTAVAIYFSFWFPNVPQWIWVVSVSAGLVGLNTMHVGRFGEIEYWFALIKVVAILVFIAVGAALIFGIGTRHPIGLTNLTANGGFLPHGWLGVWLALTLVVTSYMGVEVIAVTAGEAENPEKSIPKAMRTIVFRLIFFYVLAITVMLAMTPWNQTGAGTGLTASPFVRAFSSVGVPFAATIMNIVVITAALSSCNTDLYLTTRMLFLVGAWQVRAGIALEAGQKWSTAPCTRSFFRRHGRRDSSRHLRTRKSISRALRRRRCRNVFRLGRHPPHAHRFSPRPRPRAHRETSHAHPLLSLFHDSRHRGSRRNHRKYFFRRWIAIYGSRIRSVPGAHHHRILVRAASRATSLGIELGCQYWRRKVIFISRK